MGKQRPIQHVIDEKACLQFPSSLPDSWLFRRLYLDYGIDGEVEIFENDQSTGIIFKVQIKGTENPKFISNDSLISFSLTLDDVVYFCEELNVTMIFILCVNQNYTHSEHNIKQNIL